MSYPFPQASRSGQRLAVMKATLAELRDAIDKLTGQLAAEREIVRALSDDNGRLAARIKELENDS